MNIHKRILEAYRNLVAHVIRLRETEGEERCRPDYNALIEYINDAVFSVTPGGVFLHLNAGAARLFGGAPNDFIGKTVGDMFAPEIADHYMHTLHDVCASGEISEELIRVVIHDTNRWFENVMLPLKDETGNVSRVLWRSMETVDNMLIPNRLKHKKGNFENMFKGSLVWLPDEGRVIHKNGTVKLIATNTALICNNRLRHLYPVGKIAGVTEQKKSPRWNQHLSCVLQAMHSINRHMTREKDPHNFLHQVCETLVHTRSYSSAWIGTLNQDGSVDVACESGVGHCFLLLKERFVSGQMNECAREALAQPGVMRIANPESECLDCPLAGKEPGAQTMTTRVEHDGHVYGILSVSLPADLATLVTVHELLIEISRVIAFALSHIELEREGQEMKRQLKEREEIFRSISSAAQDAIIMVDHKGRISFWNNAAHRIFGYTPSEAIGMELHSLLCPEKYLPSYYSAFPHFQKTGDGRLTGTMIECEAVRKDGSLVAVELSLSSMRLFNHWHAIGILRDITDRRRKEKELKEAKERAERSDKFKDAFIANISHEIRTPLNVILGYTSVIADAFSEHFSEEAAPFLENIENAGMRLMHTVDSIVNISRMQVGDLPFKVSPVDINVLVEQVIESMRDLARQKQLELHFKSALNSVAINGDAFLLSLVFENVIDNAIKYTNSGSVTLHLFQNRDGSVIIEVLDTGIGISKEYLPFIFEPYTQEEIGYSRTYEGIGLGLTLSRKVIELHKGKISVYSEKDQGTTLTISFPASIVHQPAAGRIEPASKQ
ncbi:MAG: PAS domain S-box protein [Chlorobi bacterium]|nr:PAS domain S-box protein [Chlorobiota bacterium]